MNNRACVNTISKKVWEKIILEKKTYAWLEERYFQPDWCSYPDALQELGCWSLTSWPWQMTKKRCRSCELFKDN